MKSTMSAAARDYVRAFYRDNRLNLSAALVLTVLGRARRAYWVVAARPHH